MKKNLSSVCAAILLVGIMMPDASYAASGFVRGAKVQRIMATNDRFGSCMAEVSKTKDSLSCSNWVTFDCSGDVTGNTKAEGNAKFNAAQLALVTQKKVDLLITDDVKINGQCFARRLEVLNR